MMGKGLLGGIAVVVVWLLSHPAGSSLLAQTRRRQNDPVVKERSRKPPASVRKYFRQRVGRFLLETVNAGNEAAENTKQAWVILYGATDFSQGVYLSQTSDVKNPRQEDPNAEEENPIRDAINRSALLTVASFPSRNRAESMIASHTSILVGRGYALERKILGRNTRRKAGVDVTLAISQNRDDWAVIWSNGPVVFQVQSPIRQNALEFAESFL